MTIPYTPKSGSDRADIVGQVDTNDPLIVEIKIFDQSKNYGVGRIKDGFSQVMKYTNEYNKECGFLVIFNLNNVIINFTESDNHSFFPPSITYNNRTYYIVTIDCYGEKTASKLGTTKEIKVSMKDLTLTA